MLISMTVRNVALIERLEIEFHKGLHVLTGETGAGKSIVVDSINLLLGERADRGLIRTGCDKAVVEGVFDLSDCPQAKELLLAESLEPEGDLMPVMREISTADRNLCRVCGVIMPLAFLKRVTSLLVDVHGQHEHQSLLDEKTHLGFLDAFGDDAHRALEAETAAAYHAWRETSARFAALRKADAQRAERTEYLTSRAKELEAAQLQIGESEKLARERDKLAGAERINRGLQTAHESVTSGEGRQLGATELLKRAADALEQIGGFDARYQALSERIRTSFYEVEEIAIELRDLIEGEAFDPERAERIQDRLDLYRRLEKRYGMSGDDLVDYAERVHDELKGLRGMDDKLREAEKAYKARLAEYRAVAARLTESRRAVAERLQTEMERQLKDLGMGSTQLVCVFEQPTPDQKRVPTERGDDHIAFHIAPNVGEPLKPLSKTASGGELSRLMLAMKATAADRNLIPCMIFDEIDTGISGHIASVVGEKMQSIARYRQVVCVTHLAQIAALANTQYRVEKLVRDGRTVTTVTELNADERVREIARLVGASDAHMQSGLAHAREMLADAQTARA